MNEDTPSVPHAHILPVNDQIEHEASEDCICGPGVKFVNGGAIFTHHFLLEPVEGKG